MEDRRKICVGVIMGAHGVRGQLRLRSFTSEPEDVFSYKPLTDESGKQKFAIKFNGAMKDYFVATLTGVKDRDAAEALRGTKLFVERSALPAAAENEYYEVDLIGLAAKTIEDETIGTVLALHDYGAGAFLEIKPLSGGSFMLPFKDEFVPVVNIDEGFTTVLIPDGWTNTEEKK